MCRFPHTALVVEASYTATYASKSHLTALCVSHAFGDIGAKPAAGQAARTCLSASLSALALVHELSLLSDCAMDFYNADEAPDQEDEDKFAAVRVTSRCA